MKVANGRGLDQSRQNEPTEVRLRADNAPQVPRPVEAGVSDATSVPSTAVRTKHSNRVSALKLGGEAPKRPRVAPFSGVGSRVTAVDEVIRQTDCSAWLVLFIFKHVYTR